MARLTSAFSAGASRAQSTGKKIGDGVQNGVKNGLSKLPSMATQAMSRFHSAFSSGGAKAVTTAKRVGSSIASALRSAHSSVYSAGRYIGQGLVNGLSSMLGRVRSAAAKIAAAVDKAVQAKAKIGSPSKVMIRNGRYIGMGLAIGVGREQSAVYAAGTRLAVAASLGITDEAEIHSPSRKAMRHGANVGKGFANGLLSSFKTVQTSSKRLAKTAFQSLQSITGGKKGSFSSTATKVGKTYEKSLTANLNDQLSKTKKRLNKLVKKNKGLKKTLNTVYDQYSKYLKQGSDKAISETKDRLDELGDAYQKKYEAFRDRLRDYGDLFTADKYGYVSLKNFDEMTKQMKALGTNLEKLKGWGVSQSLMEEIAGMDTASALTMTNELLNRGKTAAQAYGKSYDKAMSTAASVSDKFYQSYFNADVEKELGSLQTKLTSIGKNAMEGFIKGMKSKTKSLKGASKSLANSVIGIFKKYLKIHSPSKVFAELGWYVGQGFANGMESTGRMIERVAADVISIPAGAPPSLALAGGGQLSPDYDYYDTDREYTIVSVLDVDGREFARATAPYTQRELNKLQTRDSRKRGVR